MFHVTFSDQSLAELKKIDTLEQLEVINPLSQLTESQLAVPKEPLGRFSRGKKTIYRLRSGEYRMYFERDGITLARACFGLDVLGWAATRGSTGARFRRLVPGSRLPFLLLSRTIEF